TLDHLLVRPTEQSGAEPAVLEGRARESGHLLHHLSQMHERRHFGCARRARFSVPLEGVSIEPLEAAVLDGFGLPMSPTLARSPHRTHSRSKWRKSRRAWCIRVHTVATGTPRARAASSPDT